jgi:translation initiation factor 2 subunit 1
MTGELVVSTVVKIFDQGAFVSLDEYGGKEGMVHISEVASGWIKNIRDHVREGQKVVCKVLTVDPSRNLVDLSIRRVKDSERRWKTERLKLEQRAEKLLELAAKKLGKTLDQAYEEIGFPLQEKFGDIYAALEVAAKDPECLKEAVKDRRWLKALGELAVTTVQPPSYKVVGHVELSCTAPDGVEVIRSAMIRARNAVEEGDVRAEFYLVGSPRYRVEVTAPSYKVAESTLKRVIELAVGFVTKAGGKGEFKRGTK